VTKHRHRHQRRVRCTELGPNVCARPFHHGGDPNITDSASGEVAGGPTEHLAGFILAYDWPGETERLEGTAIVDPHFARDRPVWKVTGSLEDGDLTLEPSVQMYALDGETPTLHGWVRGGKWVTA
jgi:hypothetical protein